MYILLYSWTSDELHRYVHMYILTYFIFEMDGRLALGEGTGGGAFLGGAGTLLPCTSIMSVPSGTSSSKEIYM